MEGCTALMHSIEKGYDKISKKLIYRGCEVNIKDNDGGDTALHYACRHKRKNTINILLKHNADVKIKGWK